MNTVQVIRESCKGMEDCGICAFVCPKSLFEPSAEMNSAGYLPPREPDPEKCTGCFNCEISCPDFALIVVPGEEREAAPREVINA